MEICDFSKKFKLGNAVSGDWEHCLLFRLLESILLGKRNIYNIQ